ncbi:hypothetical protein [Phytobacter sp. V91]|uniref:hypothetical protein n=1 Tax=Phytobacter sp. V91 TaxID=3369425 RepID=UPI003F640DC2
MHPLRKTQASPLLSPATHPAYGAIAPGIAPAMPEMKARSHPWPHSTIADAHVSSTTITAQASS